MNMINQYICSSVDGNMCYLRFAYYESCCYKHSCTILYEYVFNSHLGIYIIVESNDDSKRY